MKQYPPSSPVLMKPVVLAEHLAGLLPWFRRKASQAMLDFLSSFFRRLPPLSGISIVIEMPEEAGLFDDPRPHYQQLQTLREMNVVSSYYLMKKEYDDEPFIHAAIVRVAGRQRMGHSGYGKSLFCKDAAWGPAIGEAVERWSLEHFDINREKSQMLHVPEIEARTGLRFADIAGFSPAMRRAKFAQTERTYAWSDDTKFTCVKAYDLLREKAVSLPLQWFSFPHASRETDRRYEPVLSPLTSTGAATAYSREEAELRGLLEIIERDAFMIHWNRGVVPRRLPLGQLRGTVPERIKTMADRYALEPSFLLLETDFPVLVVYAVVVDRSGHGPAVVCDSAAGVDLERCLERAFLGAVALRPFLRRTLQEGAELPSVERLTIETRALWWAGRERLPLIEPFLSGAMLSFDEVEERRRRVQGLTRARLVEHFREQSLPVFSKIISTPAIRERTGLVSVMVKAPTLIPMHFNEWERCDYGERLRSVPESLGLVGTGCTTMSPHPYA